ncbi:hypothetical protein [Catellatospora coxensis]|uniref:hypothetical protein n=1 Tax=Catellatospora coxensis TaxID=310354 RepID=UPI00194110B9|nr:hypothetical protein [Catellatospora coxensis]
MIEISVWQECLRRLHHAFETSAATVRQGNEGMWFMPGHRTTEPRPLEAWAEFNGTDDLGLREELVIFVTFTRVGDSIKGEADLSTGDGMVLADGPTLVVREADSAAAILDYATAVEAFVRDCEPTLREVLCRAR